MIDFLEFESRIKNNQIESLKVKKTIDSLIYNPNEFSFSNKDFLLESKIPLISLSCDKRLCLSTRDENCILKFYSLNLEDPHHPIDAAKIINFNQNVSAMEWSDDMLVVGSRSVRLVDPESEMIITELKGHESIISSLKINNRYLILSADRSGLVAIHDHRLKRGHNHSYSPTFTLKVNSRQSNYECENILEIVDDFKFFSASDDSNAINLWDTRMVYSKSLPVPLSKFVPKGGKFSSEGHIGMIYDNEIQKLCIVKKNMMKIMKFDGVERLHEFLEERPHSKSKQNSIALSKRSKILAYSCNTENTIYFYHLQNSTKILSQKLQTNNFTKLHGIPNVDNIFLKITQNDNHFYDIGLLNISFLSGQKYALNNVMNLSQLDDPKFVSKISQFVTGSNS
ncbi:MAG: hypothetical protein MHMPM18_000892 [Marteilia pararefringens]